MGFARHQLIHAVLALALVGPALVDARDARAQTPDSPQQLLQLWQAALEAGDHAAYLACLHPGARQVPEYGSAEAMAFWADEMRDLARKGFAGEWAIEAVAQLSERFPQGSVRARPVVAGRPIDDALVLVQQADGSWTILRVFS